MRKTPIIIVLLLSCVWGYVSWYWYTCKIKGMCLVEKIELYTGEDNTYTTEINNLKSIEEVSKIPTQGGKDSTSVQQGTEPVETQEKSIEPEIQQEQKTSESKICEDIITLPIGLGAENNANQVKNLERFLNTSQQESLEENGVYEQDDYDAVKRFQVKYRSDILDPWGINAPTGYVGKTTTQKIHEIHCSQ